MCLCVESQKAFVVSVYRQGLTYVLQKLALCTSKEGGGGIKIASCSEF